MNWFTTKTKQIVPEDYDSKCEHLEVGDRCHTMHQENDSFGIVGQTFVCEECYEKDLEETMDDCTYCGREFKAKDLGTWKPYDFHAPQGDEPYRLCPACWDSDKHQERMRIDKIDYENEMEDW